ncbi:hypothetical protein IS852_000545 [Staphylococcus pseudintermedius]|nr:hypothetical protein [Staphylococcus pseudintermedius]EGQ3496352.1 hypothetical protein [Staphylococcus pseudintermedius]EGQ3559277.1 hypothetical protein [Staphylococcus pseudintermedius]EKI4485678.1 hypothetical protein [Staphylococcus pseudintermedius]MDE9988671.1 hypothetical protein [Staphylococcus pseudintermedius]
MEKQGFQSNIEDEIFKIFKEENVLSSEYSNINDLKELAISENNKNLKKMLS